MFGESNSWKFPTKSADSPKIPQAKAYIEQVFNNSMRTINSKKLSLVVNTIYRSPGGIWLREISRQTGLPPSTVHYYIGVLSPLLEDVSLGLGKGMLRVVRFKPEIQEKLSSGGSVSDVLRRVSLVKKALK